MKPNQFVTFDFNGWFDRLLSLDYKSDQSELEVRENNLGFRSSIYMQEHHTNKDQLLAGAQALSAARIARSSTSVDAVESLYAVTKSDNGTLEMAKQFASCLWRFVEMASQVANCPVHLSLIVPDDKEFGSPQIVQDGEGKTKLEKLFSLLHSERPQHLIRSRIELVWRSVAVLKSALKQEELMNQVGEVLVISVGKKISWRTLELRNWSRDGLEENEIRIVRTSTNIGVESTNQGEMQWMEDILASMKSQNSQKYDQFYRWTRWLEICTTSVSLGTLEELGIDAGSIEHRSWPIAGDQWHIEDEPLLNNKNRATDSISEKLKVIINNYLSEAKVKPLAIVIENPIGDEINDGLNSILSSLDLKVNIFFTSGAETVRTAGQLADILTASTHPESPAWLDSIPEIQLEVRENANDCECGIDTSHHTKWIAVVPSNEVVPAGEMYFTKPNKNGIRQLTLAPGIEFIHLHLRRGCEGAWEDRYTKHAIEPSDHARQVEPLARLRPLSEVARINVVEHKRNNEIQSIAETRWNDLESKRPDLLGSIPDLYIFESSEEGWQSLKPILEKIVESRQNPKLSQYSLAEITSRNSLRNELYECTQEQWRSSIFPLGSDGLPPRTGDGLEEHKTKKLLTDAIRILVSDLNYCIENDIDWDENNWKNAKVNRLHMALTWLFIGCPKEVTDTLLQSIVHPNNQIGKVLQVSTRYSAWAIYSGIGRAAKCKESLKKIYDSLLIQWERSGKQEQDKFLLAAVSHPLARRVEVRQILNEDKNRFLRVKCFLCSQLDNIVKRKFDARTRKQPALELRYVIMGYRGLMQIRYENPEWFAVDGKGECDAQRIFEKIQSVKDYPPIKRNNFVQKLLMRSAPYLIGEGVDPTMPGGF